jgi:hypothetical protein
MCPAGSQTPRSRSFLPVKAATSLVGLPAWRHIASMAVAPMPFSDSPFGHGPDGITKSPEIHGIVICLAAILRSTLAVATSRAASLEAKISLGPRNRLF